MNTLYETTFTRIGKTISRPVSRSEPSPISLPLWDNVKTFSNGLNSKSAQSDPIIFNHVKNSYSHSLVGTRGTNSTTYTTADLNLQLGDKDRKGQTIGQLATQAGVRNPGEEQTEDLSKFAQAVAKRTGQDLQGNQVKVVNERILVNTPHGTELVQSPPDVDTVDTNPLALALSVNEPSLSEGTKGLEGRNVMSSNVGNSTQLLQPQPIKPVEVNLNQNSSPEPSHSNPNSSENLSQNVTPSSNSTNPTSSNPVSQLNNGYVSQNQSQGQGQRRSPNAQNQNQNDPWNLYGQGYPGHHPHGQGPRFSPSEPSGTSHFVNNPNLPGSPYTGTTATGGPRYNQRTQLPPAYYHYGMPVPQRLSPTFSSHDPNVPPAEYP